MAASQASLRVVSSFSGLLVRNFLPKHHVRYYTGLQTFMKGIEMSRAKLNMSLEGERW